MRAPSLQFLRYRIQGTTVETLFQLWSASSRCDPVWVDIIFFRMCRSSMEGIARCLYTQCHSTHARWIKVKWESFFGISCNAIVARDRKRIDSVLSFFLFIFRNSFLGVRYMRYEIFFKYLSHELPLNISLSLTFLAYFSAILNIRGTFHWNSTSEWWASRYVIVGNMMLRGRGEGIQRYETPLSLVC